MKIRLIVTVILAAVVFSAAVVTSADGITKRLKFARGKSSTTISGAVLRGDLDTYIIKAKSGQMMYTKITSLENNAVFSIKGPDGEYLQDVGEEDDRTDAASDLPYDGDYKIIVGGTRGNANYKLTVSIK
jgi:hypothetical protein